MTQREYEMLNQAPKMGDLAVNGYGDRAYGTPEETIWNQAFETARARIENPRWLAPGLSYEGHTGNIDAPEMVNEQVFTPIQQAFKPELTAVIEQQRQQNDFRKENQRLAQQRIESNISEDKMRSENAKERNRILAGESVNRANRLTWEMGNGGSKLAAKALIAQLEDSLRRGSAGSADREAVLQKIESFQKRFPVISDEIFNQPASASTLGGQDAPQFPGETNSPAALPSQPIPAQGRGKPTQAQAQEYIAKYGAKALAQMAADGFEIVPRKK